MIYDLYLYCLRQSVLPICFVFFFYRFGISDELRFKEEPNDVTVSFGGSAFFTCKVEGNQNVKTIWTRDK